MTDGLRDRCKQFLSRQQQKRNYTRVGSPVDDLIAFVVAETGRKADDRLADAKPLCLYFATDSDREEFIAAVREAKPNMITKVMP